MYDKTWSRRVVSDWLGLCTRAEQLDQLYEVMTEKMGEKYRLPVNRNLFDDLVLLVMHSQEKPDNGILWGQFKLATRAWVKEMDNRLPHNHKDNPETNRLALRMVQLRTGALRQFKEYRQQSLFPDVS